MLVISRAWVAVGILGVVIVGILFLTGTFPSIGPTETGASGDLSFVFYDENGEPINRLAIYAGGSLISQWDTDLTLTATTDLPISKVYFTGTYTFLVEGLDEFDRLHSLKTESQTFYSIDGTFPFGSVQSWTHDASIFDEWPAYRYTGGWKVTASVSAQATASTEDEGVITAEWAGSAWFTCHWEAGQLSLTGDVGAGP